MNIIACDICKRCIDGHDRAKDATMRMKDLFLSRTFVVYNPVDDEEEEHKKMTLCTTCKETMYYYMENREALARDVQSMSLMNRIRYLFKKPMVIRGAGVDGRQDEN